MLSSSHVRQITDTTLYQSLRARKKGVALVCGGLLGLALLWAFVARNSYRSEGRLLVRLGRENVMLDPTTNLGQGPISSVPTVRDDEIYTVVETLRSRQLFERLVDELGAATVMSDGGVIAGWLGLKSDDRDVAVARVERMIAVEPLRKSNLIAVACTAKDPELAQRIVVRYLDICMTHHRGLYRNAGAEEFFAEQVRLLSEKLRDTESKIVAIKGESGVTSVAEQQRLLLARSAALEEEFGTIELGIAAGNGEVALLRKQLAELPATVVLEQSSGHGHMASDAMREQLYVLEMQEKELQAQLTEEHFRLRQVREKLAETRQIYARQQADRKQTTEGPNRAYEQVRSALLSREAELAALEERRRAVEPQLAEVRRRLDAMNRSEVQLVQLERERTLQQDDYLKYSQSLEQVRIDRALDSERISNLGIAQPPTLNRTPVGPNRLLGLMLAGILAVFAAPGYVLVADKWEQRGVLATQPPAPKPLTEAAEPAAVESTADVAPSATDEHEDRSENGRIADSTNGHAPVRVPRYVTFGSSGDPSPPPAATF